MLCARTATNESMLIGVPTGSLSWNDKEIERVDSSGTNWIRFVSGLQICWGELSNVEMTTLHASGLYWGQRVISFPKTFITAPQLTSNYYPKTQNPLAWSGNCTTLTTTSVNLRIVGVVSDTVSIQYIAIGYWK